MFSKWSLRPHDKKTKDINATFGEALESIMNQFSFSALGAKIDYIGELSGLFSRQIIGEESGLFFTLDEWIIIPLDYW